MDGWMDNEQMDGWTMNKRMGGQKDGVEGRLNKRMEGRLREQRDGRLRRDGNPVPPKGGYRGCGQGERGTRGPYPTLP